MNTHGGVGFELLRRAGIETGIMTSENTKMLERSGAKMEMITYAGVKEMEENRLLHKRYVKRKYYMEGWEELWGSL